MNRREDRKTQGIHADLLPVRVPSSFLSCISPGGTGEHLPCPTAAGQMDTGTSVYSCAVRCTQYKSWLQTCSPAYKCNQPTSTPVIQGAHLPRAGMGSLGKHALTWDQRDSSQSQLLCFSVFPPHLHVDELRLTAHQHVLLVDEFEPVHQ